MSVYSVDAVFDESLAADFEAIRVRLAEAHGRDDDAEIRELGAAIRGIADNLETIRAARAHSMAERAEAALRRKRLN